MPVGVIGMFDDRFLEGVPRRCMVFPKLRTHDARCQQRHGMGCSTAPFTAVRAGMRTAWLTRAGLGPHHRVFNGSPDCTQEMLARYVASFG